MTRLHEISTRLVEQDSLQQLLDEMMEAAVLITGADMGTLQLLDPAAEALNIVAQRGFDRAFCDFFESVHQGDAACGTAMERGQRVIVEDVTQSPIFVGTPASEVLLAAGVRAVQSTPLVNRSGKLIGMFSTHYRAPHRPGESQLRLLDVFSETDGRLHGAHTNRGSATQFTGGTAGSGCSLAADGGERESQACARDS